MTREDTHGNKKVAYCVSKSNGVEESILTISPVIGLAKNWVEPDEL